MTEFETSTYESNNQEDITELKSKKPKFIGTFWIVLLIFSAISFVICRELYIAPMHKDFSFADTNVSIDATYNRKYNLIRIDLIANEIIEEWQVDVTGGKIQGILLECETKDKSLKKEFQFDDISLEVGKNVTTSLSIENAKLKDYIMVKDLLNGDLTIKVSDIISVDKETRQKMKNYYTSGASILGQLFLYQLMGGY